MGRRVRHDADDGQTGDMVGMTILFVEQQRLPLALDDRKPVDDDKLIGAAAFVEMSHDIELGILARQGIEFPAGNSGIAVV